MIDIDADRRIARIAWSYRVMLIASSLALTAPWGVVTYVVLVLNTVAWLWMARAMGNLRRNLGRLQKDTPETN